MTWFGRNRQLLWIFLAAALSSSVAPGLLTADEVGKANPLSKAAPIKPDAPAPGLTERERWLLDRVEQLEKRVADLESKGNPTAAPLDASAAPPPSANTARSVAAAVNSSVTPGPTPARSDSLSNGRVAARGPQATEKGKPGAAKSPAAEPFAFADFTWLNGNSRTKELAMDTKFFT